ncbi:MAG: HPr(Ser) kinase/phosphatase [Oscillospiraceae bacterium]|jgi:HPr kinase/phosphorylase|nr:HPr(Ser) kinase/phosphatase [Oscillospiraceae bacterium]
MSSKFTVSLEKIIKELSLEIAFMPSQKEAKDVLVASAEVNRLGLELTGYMEYFDHERIILFGKTEFAYLEGIDEEKKVEIFGNIFAQNPPAAILARGLQPTETLLKCAKKHNVVLLLSQDSTSALIAALIAFLSVELAPRITRHGVLVEVYGEGCLITGDSGVGKSETAIELIKRGHRLIADDAVEIRKVSRKRLVGSSPANIRHFIELRGIGIINARRIFGMGAVKLTEKIDLVVHMEQWDNKKVYDRMGIDSGYMNILDIEVPTLTIPVKPGRNLAIIIEVAAMNHRQKKMGYNAAKELLKSLGMGVPGEDDATRDNDDGENVPSPWND